MNGIESMLGIRPASSGISDGDYCIALGTFEGGNELVARTFDVATQAAIGIRKGYAIRTNSEAGCIAIGASTAAGILYGVFHFLRLLGTGSTSDLESLELAENPKNGLRMINQWDNIDGSIERGYAGKSIFYLNNEITNNTERVRDYARPLASTGVNAISINNVNVHHYETMFLTDKYLPDVARLAVRVPRLRHQAVLEH